MLTHALPNHCALRLLEEGDAEELYTLIDRNRHHLTPWMPWAQMQTLEATTGFIRLTRRQLADNDGFQTAITCAGHIVGMVGFHRVDWLHRSTSIGYWLDEEHQGKGTMTAAVRALVDFAFGTWHLRRVEIRAAAGSDRSHGVPQRLGFTHEGTLRQAQRHGGGYTDLALYAVLAQEWTAAAHPAPS